MDREGVDFVFTCEHIAPATFAHCPGNPCTTPAHAPAIQTLITLIGIELYKKLHRLEFNPIPYGLFNKPNLMLLYGYPKTF